MAYWLFLFAIALLVAHASVPMTRWTTTFVAHDGICLAYLLSWGCNALISNPLQFYNPPIFYPDHNIVFSTDCLELPALICAPFWFVLRNPYLVSNILVVISHLFAMGAAFVAARRVFGVDPGAVTLEQRSKAKMVSYGLAYGMEAYGLGQRLNIPTEEAAVILDAYFAAFPSVKAYMERTVEEARQRGYTETLFGRRRQIPELASSNFRIRQAGERQAMNAGIQGLAADIFKVALVRLDAALDQAAGLQQVVGLEHGGGADAALAAGLAHRGQPRPGRKLAAAN